MWHVRGTLVNPRSPGGAMGGSKGKEEFKPAWKQHKE